MKRIRIIWNLLLIIVTVHGQESDGEKKLTNAEITAILDKMVNDTDYRVRPNVDGAAVFINCAIYVLSFGSISEQDMDYTMSLNLYLNWHDPRLEYTGTQQQISVSADVLNDLWTPDIFFPTEKEAYFHEVTFPNKLMRINPDGSVEYEIRLTLRMACNMDLKNYPMDEQECDFMLESYTNAVSELVVEWHSIGAVTWKDTLELPQFDLLNISTVFCEDQPYKAGNFSCLKARIFLKRQFGYFLLQTYIPSILIVMISWISFWINMDAVPARISLGVTTVLTMATQSTSAFSIPRISYPKAIDVWVFACMIFVFAALIEYAFVNALSQPKVSRPMTSRYCVRCTDRDKERSYNPAAAAAAAASSRSFDNLHRRTRGSNDGDQGQAPAPEKAPPPPPHQRWRRAAIMIDTCSKVLFPLAFCLFNAAYWWYYTTRQSQEILEDLAGID